MLTNVSSFQEDILLTQRDQIMKVIEIIKTYLNDLNEKAKRSPVPNSFCLFFLKNKNLRRVSYKKRLCLGNEFNISTKRFLYVIKLEKRRGDVFLFLIF